MYQNINFFTLNDLSPTALCIWSSPSIINYLGYEPEEAVGLSPYQWIHPDDIEGCKVAHKETLVNEIAGTQLFVRLKHKNGTYAPYMVLGVICFHYLISCFSIMYEEDDSSKQNCAELERINRNHKNLRSTWNPTNFDMDLRACLFLNRFTRNLCIMYASPSCELVLNIDPDDLLGKPLLLFIRADDLASFVEQSDSAKTTSTMRHLRFWFQSPNYHQEIPLEAIFLGAADALIIIFRRCLPFRRKQFITNYSSQEYFTRRLSNKSIHNYNTSTRGYSRHRGSSFGKVESYSPYGRVYSIRESPIFHSGSPTDSISSASTGSLPLSTPPSSLSSSRSQGTRAYQAPLRNIHVGSINSIRNLDSEQTRLRPLASFHNEETDAAEPTAKHLIREIRTQDSEVETCLVEGLEKIKLAPDRRKVIDKEKDRKKEAYHSEDVYFDEDRGRPTAEEKIEEIQMPYSMRRQLREE
ncbi:hypothetical protein BGX21_004633 [Mortierella sp. AD011]|nr:hypothetical protein BGX21_004633 [Mortierella sp. AD011]